MAPSWADSADRRHTVIKDINWLWSWNSRYYENHMQERKIKRKIWFRENCVCVDLGSASSDVLSVLWAVGFLGGIIKTSASDVRSQRCSTGIYCGFNVKREPAAVYSSIAGTHLTYSYWQQRGWGRASSLTAVIVCVYVCMCVMKLHS